MGRTLHYTIKKEKSNFTKDELIKIYDVCKFYNSDALLKEINETFKSKLKELWTCENFWIGIGNFYPNWYNPTLKNGGADFAWDLIHKRSKELEKTMHYYDVIQTLEKEGLIINEQKNTKELHAFTKVQGNEFNSLLVFQALISISKKLPKVTITLSDEGEFLLCDIKIKNGKAFPVIDELLDDMRHYALTMLFSKGFKGNILENLTTTDFTNEFGGDIGINNTYGDMTEYINNKLRNLKEIETALIKAGLTGNKLYLFNLNNLEEKNWFDPKVFTRNVDVEKFLDYKMSAGTMMAGFSGEGFGLTDKDSEAESYKSIARMFSLLEKAGLDKKNIQILGANNE